MAGYFEKKNFVVTGASSGIGRALAKALVASGATVLAMARREERLRELQDELGSELIPFKGDVTDRDQCRAAIDASVSRTGVLHGLIHNAGVSMRGLAEDTREEVYRRLMEVNFFSMIHFYHAAGSYLKQSGGHLVAVSSVMGKYATHERSGYCASKHALQGFMDSVRLETASYGLHTMVVSPGFVQTEISINALKPDGMPYAVNGMSTQNGLDPDVVAKDILKGIEKRKRDLYPAGFKEKMGLFLSKWAPSRLDKVLLNIQIK